MFKKLLASILLTVFLFTSIFVPVAKAQWYNSDFTDWFTKVYDADVSPDSEIFGERYTAAQVEWVIYSLVAFMVNHMGDKDLNACLMTAKDTSDAITRCLSEIVAAFGRLATPGLSATGPAPGGVALIFN